MDRTAALTRTGVPCAAAPPAIVADLTNADEAAALRIARASSISPVSSTLERPPPRCAHPPRQRAHDAARDRRVPRVGRDAHLPLVGGRALRRYLGRRRRRGRGHGPRVNLRPHEARSGGVRAGGGRCRRLLRRQSPAASRLWSRRSALHRGHAAVGASAAGDGLRSRVLHADLRPQPRRLRRAPRAGLTTDAQLAARLSGKALCIGDAHARCSEVHGLLLSCRTDAHAVDAAAVRPLPDRVRRVYRRLAHARHAQLARPQADVRRAVLHGWSAAASQGRGLRAIGFEPPYAWPDGIQATSPPSSPRAAA